jgi:hypothetical protein
MLDRAGKIYDPIIMKLFVNCIGIFPIGTLVLLDNQELGVVVENNPNPEKWDHPRVKIIADSKGKEVNGEIADLADSRCGVTIKETLDPNQYKIDVSNYFL